MSYLLAMQMRLQYIFSRLSQSYTCIQQSIYRYHQDRVYFRSPVMSGLVFLGLNLYSLFALQLFLLFVKITLPFNKVCIAKGFFRQDRKAHGASGISFIAFIFESQSIEILLVFPGPQLRKNNFFQTKVICNLLKCNITL